MAGKFAMVMVVPPVRPNLPQRQPDIGGARISSSYAHAEKVRNRPDQPYLSGPV